MEIAYMKIKRNFFALRFVAVGWRQRIASCESLPLEENNESHLVNRFRWMKITNCALRIVVVGMKQRIASCNLLSLERDNESHLVICCRWKEIMNCALRFVAIERRQRIAYPDSLQFVRGDKYEALGRHLFMNERSKSV